MLNTFKTSEPHWFPMRISYSSLSRLMAIKERLDENVNVYETYVPLIFKKVSPTKMDFGPSLTNYIFVRSTYNHLKQIKSNQELYSSLRFIVHTRYDEKFNKSEEIVYVSDKMMQDFMLVTDRANENVVFLDNLEYACKPSQCVQVTEGEFAGVIGRIKRIHGNICVVIPIQDTAAVAILNLPRKYLRYIEE